MGGSSTPLLSVKYAVPPARTGTVVRQRLADRLEGSGDTRLCVVVAPPGWGKTTMLSQWTADPVVRGRAAWVSLDPSDDEPVRFWSYLLTALSVVAPDVGNRALATLSAPGVEPVLVTLPLLINDAAASNGRYVLILDDVHVLHDRRLLEGLEFLITYLPPSLRLVLAGRADPALPLGRWRGRGQLTEIRAPELAFTLSESEALLAAVGVTDLDSSACGLLWQRTEGWAVGLHLAAQAVRSSPDLPAAVARLRGDDRHLLDYFETEILDQLEPAQREFLVQTSVLDRLSGPLCDAVLGRSGSARDPGGAGRSQSFRDRAGSRSPLVPLPWALSRRVAAGAAGGASRREPPTCSSALRTGTSGRTRWTRLSGTFSSQGTPRLRWGC